MIWWNKSNFNKNFEKINELEISSAYKIVSTWFFSYYMYLIWVFSPLQLSDMFRSEVIK